MSQKHEVAVIKKNTNGLTAIASGPTIDDDGKITVNNLSVTTLYHNNILNNIIMYKHNNNDEGTLTSIKYNETNQYFEFYVSGKAEPYIVPEPPVIVTITEVINSYNTVTLTANVSNLQSDETITTYIWNVNSNKDSMIHASNDNNTIDINLVQYRNEKVNVTVNTNMTTGIESEYYNIPSINLDEVSNNNVDVTITAIITNIDDINNYAWSYQKLNESIWRSIIDGSTNTLTVSLSTYKDRKIRLVVNYNIESDYYIVPSVNIDGGGGGGGGSGSGSGGGDIIADPDSAVGENEIQQ